MNDAAAPTYRQLTAFFIPLALQAASQSLTYPLVAMVASHGPGGTLNLAGVAQSNIVMFLVGAVGAASSPREWSLADPVWDSRGSSPSTASWLWLQRWCRP